MMGNNLFCSGNGGWAPKSNHKGIPTQASLSKPSWSKNRLDDEIALVMSHMILVDPKNPTQYFGIMSDGTVCVIHYQIHDWRTNTVINKFISAYPI